MPEQQEFVYEDNLNTSACKMTENYFGKGLTFFQVIIPFLQFKKENLTSGNTLFFCYSSVSMKENLELSRKAIINNC